MSESKFPSVHEVAIAGLLHDIGKLIQRARPGGLPAAVRDRQSDVLPSRDGHATHWHALWSDWFFDLCDEGSLAWPKGTDCAWVRNLAVYHHRPLQDYRTKPELALSGLVTLADWIAAGFERKAQDAEDEAHWDDSVPKRERFRRMPIDALVSKIKLERTNGKLEGTPDRKCCHDPKEMSPESLVPVEAGRMSGEDVEDAYASLWDNFRKNWNDSIQRCSIDPTALEEAVLSLSERFLWAVPSSTMDQPDISLHDHSRAVAAFAAALFRYHQEAGSLEDAKALTDRSKPAFRFLVGDLSGIQSTLFRFRSEQVSGLNKTLRGRSLRFQLITDAAARRMLSAFGMPMSAMLQAAGGRFLMVVPALADAEDRLQKLREDFDGWFVQQYSGDLAMGLSLSVPFAADDLIEAKEGEGAYAPRKRAEAVRGSLSVAIETAKLHLLAEQAAEGVVQVSFESGACASCGLRPAGGKGLCDACEAERSLGNDVPRSRAVIVREDGHHGDDILGCGYILASGDGQQKHDHGTGWRWFSKNGENYGPAPLRAGPGWVARFGEDISRYSDIEDAEEGQIMTFQALARDGRETDANGKPVGREMLALLKGDVDRLGQIFAGGLGERWSVARNAALSRMMDAYFSLRLPWLLETEFPESYTVYAGGDDFMLVLPWRQGFELARRLHEDFAAFAGQNPSLTFSLGVALFDPRTPISIAAHEAEERLEAAKDAGRNRVCAIEPGAMTWAAFSMALERAEKLNVWQREGKLSTALLYRLLAIDDARQRVSAGNKARPADYAWMARLGYQLARNVKAPEIGEELRSLFGLDGSWTHSENVPPGTRLSISHALYRNR
jgi:CRISPR-associated protein Csm1